MGYRIDYEDYAALRRKSAHRSSFRLAGLTAAFFLSFLLLTHAFWPAGRAKLRSLLLPGDPEVTGQALSSMVEDLRAGKPLSDSVTAFCREILEYAQYPD